MCVWYLKVSFPGHPVNISHDIWKLTHWTLTKHLLQHAAANNLLKRCIFGLASTMILHNLQIIFSQDTKKLDNTSTQWISWPLLHLTWLTRHETWLSPCGTHWGGRWGSSGPNEVSWPCETLGCKNFLVRMQQRRSKRRVKRRLNLKFYKLFAPPLNNDFSHGAGVQ